MAQLCTRELCDLGGVYSESHVSVSPCIQGEGGRRSGLSSGSSPSQPVCHSAHTPSLPSHPREGPYFVSFLFHNLAGSIAGSTVHSWGSPGGFPSCRSLSFRKSQGRRGRKESVREENDLKADRTFTRSLTLCGVGTPMHEAGTSHSACPAKRGQSLSGRCAALGCHGNGIQISPNCFFIC